MAFYSGFFNSKGLDRTYTAEDFTGYVQFKFTFDGDWKKFHKVVQFSQCDEIYSIVLGFDGATCYLPAELHYSTKTV